MWRILQYNLLFSSYFDHSIHKKPKAAEHLILYTLCNMKNAKKKKKKKKHWLGLNCMWLAKRAVLKTEG